jgi:hypothetical protein
MPSELSDLVTQHIREKNSGMTCHTEMKNTCQCRISFAIFLGNLDIVGGNQRTRKEVFEPCPG